MDSNCPLTFDPGIMLLSTRVVISMRLLDSRKDILSGPCALLLKASASSATTFDQDANLDIPVTTIELEAMYSVLCLDANTGTDQAVAAFFLVKEESKGVLSLVTSAEDISSHLLVNAELDMLITSKGSTPHFIRYSSEPNAEIVLSLMQFV
jgi:hypothetical protein